MYIYIVFLQYIYIYKYIYIRVYIRVLAIYQGVDSAYARLEPGESAKATNFFYHAHNADLTSIQWFGRVLLLKRSGNWGWEDVLINFPRAYHALNYYRYEVTGIRDVKILFFHRLSLHTHTNNRLCPLLQNMSIFLAQIG